MVLVSSMLKNKNKENKTKGTKHITTNKNAYLVSVNNALFTIRVVIDI